MITIQSPSRIESIKLEEIREIIARIIGLSIIEETKKKVVLTCSIDPFKFNIYSLIRRLSAIAAAMFDESIEALQKHELMSDVDLISEVGDLSLTRLAAIRLPMVQVFAVGTFHSSYPLAQVG